jgi:hypothetical protein
MWIPCVFLNMAKSIFTLFSCHWKIQIYWSMEKYLSLL